MNTISGVVPHAFNTGQGHGSIKEIPRSRLQEMVFGHLQGRVYPNSEFSSWSASIVLVLCYCQWKASRGETGIHITIIDVYHLALLVAAWHVPQLLEVLRHGSGYAYLHEHLAHGRIAGRGCKALPLSHPLANTYSASSRR